MDDCNPLFCETVIKALYYFIVVKYKNNSLLLSFNFKYDCEHRNISLNLEYLIWAYKDSVLFLWRILKFLGVKGAL